MYITLTIKEWNTIKSVGAVKVLCDMMMNNNFCIHFYLFIPPNLKNTPHITTYYILYRMGWRRYENSCLWIRKRHIRAQSYILLIKIKFFLPCPSNSSHLSTHRL